MALMQLWSICNQFRAIFSRFTHAILFPTRYNSSDTNPSSSHSYGFPIVSYVSASIFWKSKNKNLLVGVILTSLPLGDPSSSSLSSEIFSSAMDGLAYIKITCSKFVLVQLMWSHHVKISINVMTKALGKGNDYYVCCCCMV